MAGKEEWLLHFHLAIHGVPELVERMGWMVWRGKAGSANLS